MIPAIEPITVKVGSTIAIPLQFLDEADAAIDLTGYHARLQVRPSAESGTVLLDLDDQEKGGLVIDLEARTLTLDLAADFAADLVLTSLNKGRIGDLEGRLAVYDLELYTDAGWVGSPMGGPWLFIPEVARV